MNAHRVTTKKERPLVAIVDDDQAVCRAMKRLFLTHGMRAETFASGRIFIELIEAVPSFQPKCVILDMHMAGLDGLAVQVRLAALRPGLPVVFLSAAASQKEHELALAAGAVAVFRKPFDGDLERLLKALREILGTRPQT